MPETNGFPVPDRIQFARVLDGINRRCFTFTEEQFEELCRWTTLTRDELQKVLNHASEVWKDIRDQDARADEIESIRSEAAEIFEEAGIVEVDPNAEVIEVDGKEDGRPGAWVQAWLFVDADPKQPTCLQCGEPYSEGGDGWCGLCPSCADKAERKRDE